MHEQGGRNKPIDFLRSLQGRFRGRTEEIHDPLIADVVIDEIPREAYSLYHYAYFITLREASKINSFKALRRFRKNALAGAGFLVNFDSDVTPNPINLNIARRLISTAIYDARKHRVRTLDQIYSPRSKAA